MRPPIIVGVLIMAVVVAAGVMAPHLRSASSKAAEESQKQAALARRLLHRYDNQADRLAELTDLAGLKAADLDALGEQISAQLQQVNQEYRGNLSQLRGQAEQDQMPAVGVEVLPPGAAGLQRALSHYEAALAENAKLLGDALKESKAAASGPGGSTLGVPQIAGAAEYTRASSLFIMAQAARVQQRRLQARLLLLATRWKIHQTFQDYLHGLDVKDILMVLRGDLSEVQDMNAEGRQQVETLSAQVAERQAELQAAEQALTATRDELLVLEHIGFEAGRDDSFNAYRAQFVSISKHLRELEEQEQLLRYGGRQAPTFGGDDYETAEITGGEVVIGLEELERRLSKAEERASRLEKAVEALEQHVSFVEQAGRDAKQGEDRYTDLLTELDAKQEDIRPLLMEAVKEAMALEAQALDAARSAANAFGRSQQAADAWSRSASEEQSTKDTERTNPRLRMMVSDPTIGLIGDSAKAAALALSARIQTEQIEAT
ncbi:MAG: hypothetical protein ABIG44_07915, partial [Planctomycetota bacterium]